MGVRAPAVRGEAERVEAVVTRVLAGEVPGRRQERGPPRPVVGAARGSAVRTVGELCVAESKGSAASGARGPEGAATVGRRHVPCCARRRLLADPGLHLALQLAHAPLEVPLRSAQGSARARERGGHRESGVCLLRTAVRRTCSFCPTPVLLRAVRPTMGSADSRNTVLTCARGVECGRRRVSRLPRLSPQVGRS